MKLLYFAWVRERIGKAEEHVDPLADVGTVADLDGVWLAKRDDQYAHAFENAGVIRAAIDHRHVRAGRGDRRRQRNRIFPADDGRLGIFESRSFPAKAGI